MNNEIRKMLNNTKNINLLPIKHKFDLTTLNMIIAFLYKDSVLLTRKVQSNILKLINNLDMSLYEKNQDLQERIWIIKKTIECRLIDKIETNGDMVMSYCLNDLECTPRIKKIIESIPKLSISHEESKYLLNKLDDILRFGYVTTLREIWIEIINEIDDSDFKSYKAIQNDLAELANSVINAKRNTSSLESDQTFSLSEDVFENVINESLKKLQDRNKIFRTGIQYLNTLLAPGYQSKRLYLYLAFPGMGKSTVLLKSALDFKKFNNVKPKDPDKRPAVLFLTLENGIEETVERIFNMTTDSDDIRNYTSKQLIKKLRKESNLALTEDSPIDIIIKEYKNREIDTNDIYAIINDLSDEGVEVVGLVVDYIKRLRPSEKANDEKGELKNISNELKEIAKYFDIPVITAQQLNRSSATVVDSALQQDKQDITRLIGRDGISGAWELMENSDWVCIINPETKSDSGEEFLTFKLLKRRYRSSEDEPKLRDLTYFNHPFEAGNHIRLIDDIELPEPISLISLSTAFEPSVNNKRGAMSMVDRNIDKKEKKKKIPDSTEFDAFNPDNSINY